MFDPFWPLETVSFTGLLDDIEPLLPSRYTQGIEKLLDGKEEHWGGSDFPPVEMPSG